MENIKQTLNGNILILEVDISKRGEISKTGKTIRIASSEGNKRIKGTYRDWETDRKSTRLNSSHRSLSRMPSSA